MLNFNSILIFSENPKLLVDFYCKVLAQKPGWSNGEYNGFKVGSGYLTIGPHDKVHGKNKNPERIMFNLETDDLKKEFDRIKKLGAKVVQAPYHPSEEDDNDGEGRIATFADLDGNFFQLMTPFKM